MPTNKDGRTIKPYVKPKTVTAKAGNSPPSATRPPQKIGPAGQGKIYDSKLPGANMYERGGGKQSIQRPGKPPVKGKPSSRMLRESTKGVEGGGTLGKGKLAKGPYTNVQPGLVRGGSTPTTKPPQKIGPAGQGKVGGKGGAATMRPPTKAKPQPSRVSRQPSSGIGRGAKGYRGSAASRNRSATMNRRTTGRRTMGRSRYGNRGR